MKKLWIFPILGIISLSFYLFRKSTQPEVAYSATLISPQVDTTGFTRAEGDKKIGFPEDQGPHPDYQTEWWYYTGNLDTLDGRHFGYQLTLFRRALTPLSKSPPVRESAWASNQIYLAHFAFTDVAAQSFYNFERISRGAVDLAGAQASPYNVWLENWFVKEVEPNTYHLYATQDDLVLDLTLIDIKGPVLQGNQGYSQKGPEPGNASYYISQTRLESKGTIQVGKDLFQVKGFSWMDHEFSTSALSEGQIGWDWFSVQLDSDTELMFFQGRRENGSIDPFSSGTIIYPDGSLTTLKEEDFSILVEDTWISPKSGAEYPSRWEVNIPSGDIHLFIEPHLADQELQVSYTYWEGAVKIRGVQGGMEVSGNGYVEMTGYAGSIAGEF